MIAGHCLAGRFPADHGHVMSRPNRKKSPEVPGTSDQFAHVGGECVCPLFELRQAMASLITAASDFTAIARRALPKPPVTVLGSATAACRKILSQIAGNEKGMTASATGRSSLVRWQRRPAAGRGLRPGPDGCYCSRDRETAGEGVFWKSPVISTGRPFWFATALCSFCRSIFLKRFFQISRFSLYRRRSPSFP